MQFQRGWRGGGPIKPDQIKPVARTTRRPNRPVQNWKHIDCSIHSIRKWNVCFFGDHDDEHTHTHNTKNIDDRPWFVPIFWLHSKWTQTNILVRQFRHLSYANLYCQNSHLFIFRHFFNINVLFNNSIFPSFQFLSLSLSSFWSWQIINHQLYLWIVFPFVRLPVVLFIFVTSIAWIDNTFFQRLIVELLPYLTRHLKN